MTLWVTEKVALVETPIEPDGVVRAQQVTGLIHTRTCGCQARIGIRLDTQETTFGARPCADHAAANARALQLVQTMPPSDREMLPLWEELLEAELAKDQAAA